VILKYIVDNYYVDQLLQQPKISKDFSDIIESNELKVFKYTQERMRALIVTYRKNCVHNVCNVN
jgi:hypothetical protein